MSEAITIKNKVSAKHIAPIAAIMTKIGIKELAEKFNAPEFQAAENADESVLSRVGMTVAIEMASVVLANIGKCEKDIFALLADLTDTDSESIANVPIDEFAQLVIDVIQAEEFKQVFRLASKLLK